MGGQIYCPPYSTSREGIYITVHMLTLDPEYHIHCCCSSRWKCLAGSNSWIFICIKSLWLSKRGRNRGGLKILHSWQEGPFQGVDALLKRIGNSTIKMIAMTVLKPTQACFQTIMLLLNSFKWRIVHMVLIFFLFWISFNTLKIN